MALQARSADQHPEKAFPTKEKWLFLVRSLNIREYLSYIKAVLPADDERLVYLQKTLSTNDQLYGPVLYRSFRLVEGIMLWNVHQGNRGVYLEKKYSPQHVAKLLMDLTNVLNEWQYEVFRTDAHASNPELSRDKYKTAAQLIVSQAAPIFTSIAYTKSPDIKAHSIRMALSLITEPAEGTNHVSTLLRGRALQMGTKMDVGEDEFYDALSHLVASWTEEERKEITKQLGDMLGIDSEQNQHIHIPVTTEMMRLAGLILANIRLHNQLAADFGDKAKNRKQVLTAARGPELGTEPIPALLNKLQKALKAGKFSETEKTLANQLFEIMLVEARLVNPAVILAIVETYGMPKLREALIKAYSRRDASFSMEHIDDVLMYMVTGTFSSKLSHQAHSLAEQGLGWLVEDLGETGLGDMLASLIRSTAKFGLHSIHGVNPIPQAYIFKPAPNGKPVTVQDLNVYFEGVNAPNKQKMDTIRPILREKDYSLRAIEGSLVGQRRELIPETKESLKIRLRRFLEVENTLWNAVVATLQSNGARNSKTAVALWNLSFTTCLNLLSEPSSEFFQLDPTLVAEFSSTLAQRITARYDSLTQLRGSRDTEAATELKTALLWSVNQAAGHWSPPVVTALFNQIEQAVAQKDSHYFSGLVPDLINAVTLERVPTVEGKPAQYRTQYNEKAITLLVTLLKKFTTNDSMVGKEARMSLTTTLSTISGDLKQLAQNWTHDKEYQWQYQVNTEDYRKKERDSAGVATLLNLLAAHIGGDKTQQRALAQALSTEIGQEIAAVFQAKLPSSSLIDNLMESREALAAQDTALETKAEAIKAVAQEQLNNLKNLAKTKKLNLNSVHNLIKNSLSAFGSTLAAQSTLNLSVAKKTLTNPEQPLDGLDVLTALTQPYLTGRPAPEIAPLGAMLADVLGQRFQGENLALLPIEQLRQKISQVLSEELMTDLTQATALEAEIVSQKVLASSLQEYFKAADVFMAVENAEFAQEDLQQLKNYIAAVREVRKLVTDIHSPIEQELNRIRRNLANILGTEARYIRMPDWKTLGGFMDDLEKVVIAAEKKLKT